MVNEIFKLKFSCIGSVTLGIRITIKVTCYVCRTIPQISSTFGKIPRKFPEKFGNLVQISGIQSKFREFSQDFGNLNWIFQWILRTFQWFEHYSKTLKYYWILQFTEILWNSSDSHWNSQPMHRLQLYDVMTYSNMHSLQL